MYHVVDVVANYVCKGTANSGTFARQAALKTTLFLLCKLFLHSCSWLIKLTTTIVLVLAIFSIAKVHTSVTFNSATVPQPTCKPLHTKELPTCRPLIPPTHTITTIKLTKVHHSQMHLQLPGAVQHYDTPSSRERTHTYIHTYMHTCTYTHL